MFVNLWDELKSIYDTTLLYLFAFFSLMSPGTIIWKLFSTRQGKTRLANRDLICDHHTLMNLEKSSKPLDQFTNALSPFVPLFLIENDQDWKHRREVFIYGNNLINKRLSHISFDMQLPEGKGNILWDLFQSVFRYSFELSFNRKIHDDEFKAIYPGLVDINKIIKRFSSSPNMKEREIFYQQTLNLIKENDQDFLFHHCESFFLLDELNQVSSVAEDFLTTISVQCTDLICHLLILYSSYPEEFHTNFDYCFNETLRLYPLTDLWVRQGSENERGWIASLVQLNRNGWTKCGEFLPQRWSEKDHPPLLSWGFDSRRCPAQKFATDICKRVFQTIIHTEGFWVEPAKNFDHERTFPYGCQLWIGYGPKPDQAKHWTFPNKLRMQWRRWTCEKLRMFDQKELN